MQSCLTLINIDTSPSIQSLLEILILLTTLLCLVVEKLVSFVDMDGKSASPCRGKTMSCTSSLFFLFETKAVKIITPVSWLRCWKNWIAGWFQFFESNQWMKKPTLSGSQ